MRERIQTVLCGADFDGAEVIVPNGHLIESQVVINWTLSDPDRKQHATEE